MRRGVIFRYSSVKPGVTRYTTSPKKGEIESCRRQAAWRRKEKEGNDDRMRVKCMGILMRDSNELDGEMSSTTCMTWADRRVVEARSGVGRRLLGGPIGVVGEFEGQGGEKRCVAAR